MVTKPTQLFSTSCAKAQRKLGSFTKDTVLKLRILINFSGCFVRLFYYLFIDTSNAETIDFNQGIEPKDTVWPAAEYGDFSEALARITSDEQKVYLPFEDFPTEIVVAPVTSIVC
jgi:hypothetical protein